MNIIEYLPSSRHNPVLLNDKPSAWGDIPTLIGALINDFQINPQFCLEFGVEYGYSTSAFANYFNTVIGVDTFEGDIHSGFVDNHYDDTRKRLEKFSNVLLLKCKYQDFISNEENIIFDLVHIDIVHTYDDTFACGDWSLKRCNVVIFHDTESFEDVKRACVDLALKHNCTFYNYPHSNGLGILHRNTLL